VTAPSRRFVLVHRDGPTMARELARQVTAMARRAVLARGSFSMVLAGGSSPRAFHRELADEPFRSSMPWEAVHVFFGDERLVPWDDGESNYGAARADLLAHVPVPAANVHPVPFVPHGTVDGAAGAYDDVVTRYLQSSMGRFDLVLLGMGGDGHTASLFPGTSAPDCRGRFVTAGTAPPPAAVTERVTMTYEALARADWVFFVIGGSGKTEILQAILDGDEGLPAGRVRARRGVVWHVDGAQVAVRAVDDGQGQPWLAE